MDTRSWRGWQISLTHLSYGNLLYYLRSPTWVSLRIVHSPISILEYWLRWTQKQLAKGTERDPWKVIFYHATDADDAVDREGGLVRIFRTNNLTTVTLVDS